MNLFMDYLELMDYLKDDEKIDVCNPIFPVYQNVHLSQQGLSMFSDHYCNYGWKS